MGDLGQIALVSILSHIIFIALAWYALQAVRLEKLLKPNHVFQGAAAIHIISYFSRLIC